MRVYARVYVYVQCVCVRMRVCVHNRCMKYKNIMNLTIVNTAAAHYRTTYDRPRTSMKVLKEFRKKSTTMRAKAREKRERKSSKRSQDHKAA